MFATCASQFSPIQEGIMAAEQNKQSSCEPLTKAAEAISAIIDQVCHPISRGREVAQQERRATASA